MVLLMDGKDASPLPYDGSGSGVMGVFLMMNFYSCKEWNDFSMSIKQNSQLKIFLDSL